MNTCLITGSTSGIGKATAYQLAGKGWHVILHGRKEALCQQSRDEIIRDTGNLQIDYVVADLSLMKEVAKMAGEIKQRFPELNILINNAGIISMEHRLTSDGFELTWAVNYLSRFLLTNLLLDLLKKNAPSGIVEVAGAYHAKGEIHFEDINLDKNYSFGIANSQAKLANVLFTYKLAEKLKGTGVTVNCLHPGAVRTGAIDKTEHVPVLMKMAYKVMSRFFKSPEKGAETTVYLAASPNITGISGKYFADKKELKSAPQTYDKELQDNLWNLSEKMVKP